MCRRTSKTATATRRASGTARVISIPHSFRDHWVAQQYLPDALQGRVFYQPSDQGHEASVKVEVEQRREAQLAAMLEESEGFRRGRGVDLHRRPGARRPGSLAATGRQRGQ